jgi:hypothetical protein
MTRRENSSRCRPRDDAGASSRTRRHPGPTRPLVVRIRGGAGLPCPPFLGQEVQPHDSVSNRIDILGFDEDVGVPVVIELKRERDKLHLLQALSYAAMVWTWDEDQLKTVAGEGVDDDLLNSIDNRSTDDTPRIILIAEDYDPEVILTADWLASQHEVDTTAFRYGCRDTTPIAWCDSNLTIRCVSFKTSIACEGEWPGCPLLQQVNRGMT